MLNGPMVNLPESFAIWCAEVNTGASTKLALRLGEIAMHLDLFAGADGLGHLLQISEV